MAMEWEDFGQDDDGNQVGMSFSMEQYESDDENWSNVEQNGTENADEIWESVNETTEAAIDNDEDEAVDNQDHTFVQHSEDWNQINAALNEQAANEAKTSKKEKVKRLTKAEKSQRVIERHAHLTSLMAREAQINEATNNVALQALLRSLSPVELEAMYQTRSNQGDISFFVQHLMKWFRSEFRRVPYSSAMATTFSVDSNSLMSVYFKRQGHEHEMVCLFVTLCRAWGILTRYTCVLDTPSSTKRLTTFNPYFGIDNDVEHTSSNIRSSLRAWCEIFTSKGWIHVDVVRNIIDKSKEVEKLRGRGIFLPHVVSFTADGQIIDVSRNYANDWARTQLHRVNEIWWSKLLQEGCSEENAINVDTKLPMPTSAQAFRNHSQYCLEQHLGLYEWIHPRKPVGLFKGMPVFERRAVHTLHSSYRWLRQGRVVLEAELDKPCKKVPKRKKAPAPATSMQFNDVPFSVATAVVSEGDSNLPLYGLWQTEPYIAPTVENGIIPKNEHGNIEIWSEVFLPIGSRHIHLPRAKQVAAQLGVDFAPAVVGWESRNGRSVPVFDGIVVCEDFVEMIDDAHAVLEQSIVEKAIARKKKEVAKRWGIFVKKLLLRKRLRDEYG